MLGAPRWSPSVDPSGDVAAAITGADVAHFAVHGVFSPGRPDISGLALAAPTDGFEPFGTAGGLLNVAALVALLPAGSLRLAVLSACDSALGEWSLSDDRSGLPGVMLGLGAEWVVGSHWPVGDLTTLALMYAFRRGDVIGRPAAALAAAARWLRVTSAVDIAAELRAVPWPALDTAAQLALEDGLRRLENRPDGIGPDGWAAFSAYGAPAPQEEPWLFDE